MVQSEAIQQTPAPGSRHLHCAGDTINFTLTVPSTWQGQAWLRTNLGRGRSVRREIIREIDRRETPLGWSWYDIPMRAAGQGRHALSTVLTEVGHFEAKCFFLKPGSREPLWPPGANTAVNVAPADTCCANIVYNAFVRQFGPNKTPAAFPTRREASRAQPLDRAGYTVIPPSGTFRDLIGELDFIIGHLGCTDPSTAAHPPHPDHLCPHGPLRQPLCRPELHGRRPGPGRVRSRGHPPGAVHRTGGCRPARHAKIFIDIAINHTGWAASLHETHPEWLVRDDRRDASRRPAPGA